MRNFKWIRLSLALGLTTVVAAQNANTPPTIQTLNLERVIDIKSVLTTLTPSIPPLIGAGVISGALELRESVSFNTANQVLTLNEFSVQTGAAIPTTGNKSIFSTLTINVDKIYSSMTPRPSLMLTGTVATNSPGSPFGNLTGAPGAVGIGYTTDNPAKVTDVTLMVAGSAVEFSPGAQGTLAFVQPPAPPTPSNAPQIVISSPTSVFTLIADLDASASTTANPPLTFQWTSVEGNSDIARANTAKALAYLIGGKGSYTFKVTVTDAKGNSSSQKVTINYY
jgi:hypothetical protein